MERPNGIRRLRSLGIACAAGSALIGLAAASSGQVQSRPDVVQRATTGRSPGPAPMAGVSGARSRQAPVPLPSSLRVVWRARLTGPVAFEPVVDAQGSIVVLHERGSVSQLDKAGKRQWSLRLGDAAPGAGPVLLSDGVRALLKHDQQLLRVNRSGQLLTSTPTGLSGKPSPPLPLFDGGLALASGTDLVRLDHRGQLTARAELEDSVLALLQAGSIVLAVTQAGAVYRFHGTGKLVSKGQFGHRLEGVAHNGSSLYAVTSDRHLVRFDLNTQTVRTLHTSPVTQPLSSALAFGKKAIYVASDAGVVRGFSPSGTELLRAVVADPKATPGAGFGILRSSSPLMLAGRGEHLVFAQAGNETVVIDGDGAFKAVPDSACLSPAALTPLSGGQVLLSCRNGELIALGAAADTAKP